ncbi:cyclic nucleotide-gated ion channel [Salix suchowensis]|nr:cyclic nucleotide-gated ion channel [Salix suchowensis]
MNRKGDKFVRFQDWSSEKSFSSEQRYSIEDGFYARKAKPTFNAVRDNIRRGWEMGSERIRSLKNPSRFYPRGARFISPEWNKIFMLVCVLAVAIDPLFFYIPGLKMEAAACALRTFIDVVYILRIVFQFRTGFIAPSSRVFGRGELVEDPKAIAKKYFTSYLIVDILSILPLPQAVLTIILPSVAGPVPLAAKNLLELVIFTQYIPRLVRIYPLFKEITSTSGILTETAWAGAVFNLFLYMLASHVKCPFIHPDQIQNSTVFNFGIFIDALDSGVVGSTYFPRKFFYCFWWGLRNLRFGIYGCLPFIGENLFAVFISIAGLVLFALLIGNMQKYLESTTIRIEEMRVIRRDAEQWMSHRMLPDNLRERIRRYEQYKWQETRGVEERGLIRNLPKDLRRDINRHLCLDLIKKVPIFEKMDERILDAVCDRLKATLYTKDSYIVREGDPVDEMLFIMRGNLVSVTTNGGRTGFFNAGFLHGPRSPTSSNLPISTRTVQALSEVEAFALEAEDLKTVASQFRRLHHKDIQHTFRLSSVQWRTWAACFIQAAWHRHCRRKQAKSSRQAEEKLQDALANEASTSPSLGIAIYASQFAANALRNLRQNRAHTARLPQRLSFLPQKPTEPDFSA